MSQPTPTYFDYQAAALESHLTEDQVRALEAIVRLEFPDDAMMFELHMLRLVEQIRSGHLTLEEVLPSNPS